MPDFTLWRRWYFGIRRLNSSMKTGRSGLGPTRLMSPQRTLSNCGNSSSDEARKKAPSGVRHGGPVGLGVLAHGAELQNGKRPAVHPHALLPKKNRPAATQADR